MDHKKYLSRIGSKGGAMKSEKKTIAARRNAKLRWKKKT